MPDQEKPGPERWGGDLPGTTPALPADIIERAERLTWNGPVQAAKAPSGCVGVMTRVGSGASPLAIFVRITSRSGAVATLRACSSELLGFRSFGTMGLSGSEPGYDPETRASSWIARRSLVVPDFPTLDDAKAASQPG